MPSDPRPPLADTATVPGDLGLGRLLRVFAALSAVFLLVLAIAPLRPYFAEWRTIQARYNRLARAAGQPAVAIAVQQIWNPALGVTDRCVTCHLGMGSAGPVGGDRLFAAHPPLPHDLRTFGCSVCHGGQGRATATAAAHGLVSHWDEQWLDRQDLAAGCGSCHDRAPFAPRPELARGQALVERLDCLSCHRVDGRGRGDGPDLSYAGIRGFAPSWHADHLARHARAESAAWAASYGEIAAADLATLDRFLQTRVGAPRLVEARALAMERGCLGCHKVAGRGGDEGPALDEVGRKPVGDLNFAHVVGPPTLANYFRDHFLDPSRVVPGSLMPAQIASNEDAGLLTTYVLSLRSRRLPAEFLPKDRVRREVLGEKEPPLAGPAAYGAFCAGCHGPAGEGRRYGNLDVSFPAIGGADFLDVASDEFIRATLAAGRPGRRMPPLGGSGGALSGAEVNGLIAHLRSLAANPAEADIAAAAIDPAAGAAVYRDDCAACHGAGGEGTVLGPPLGAGDRRSAVERPAVLRTLAAGVPGTAMPAYTRYDAATLASLAAHVAALPEAGAVPLFPSRAAWRLGAADASRGQPIFERICSGCHGARGEGGVGPALANAGFQQAATDAFVAVTIVRGRANTPMPAFGRDSVKFPALTGQDVLDVAAFVRQRLGRSAPGGAMTRR